MSTGRNPSVRGANRQLNRPDRDTSWRHHQMNTLSLSGRDGPTAFSITWHLPSAEFVVALPSTEPPNWCFDWLSHPVGAYVRHSKSFPWLAGDIVLSIGDESVVALNRDAFVRIFTEVWRERIARDQGAVVLSRVIREEAVEGPRLWWERFPTDPPRIDNHPMAGAADGAPRWSFALPQPASPVELLDAAGELHPLLEGIVSERWFDTFRDSQESNLLSRDGALRLLNSYWGRVYDEGDSVIADWFDRFDASGDGKLTRAEFSAAIKHSCRFHRKILWDCLHGWGYGSDLCFGAHAAAAAPLIAKATYSMLLAYFGVRCCKDDADDYSSTCSQLVLNRAEEQVLGNLGLVEYINSFLHDLPTTACIVYAIGIHENRKNPLQMLRGLQPLQVGTLLDVRGNSTRTNFSPKHLQRACAECGVTYVHYENNIHHDKFDKTGNVACVRTLEQPCVLLGDELSAESEHEVPPRLVDFTARLAEHGIAVVIHIRLTDNGKLLYATHPQSTGIKQYNDRWVPFSSLN